MTCLTFDKLAARPIVVGLTWVALATLSALSSVAAGQTPSPPPVVEELLRGDTVEPAARGAAARRQATPTRQAPEQSEHPLQLIASNMQRVQDRLIQGRAAELTQQMQDAIVSDLDRLIEQAAQQQQQQSTPQSQPPGGTGGAQATGQPGAQRPSDGAGQGAGPADLAAAARDQSGWWGKLPPQLREQLRQASNDEFLPKYEKLIEAYYRRLAEPW